MKRAKITQSELHRRSWSLTRTGANVANIYDTPQALTNGITTGNGLLNGCLQGTNSEQRIGNQVKESGLRIKGMIQHMSTAAGEVCNCVRVVILRDHDNKGVAPLPADIFEDPVAPQVIGSLVKWSNRKRFTILFDQVFSLQAQAAEPGITSACVPVDIDLRGAHGVDNTLTYNANTLDAASLQQKGLYCYLMAETTASAAPTTWPQLVGTCQFFFHDV